MVSITYSYSLQAYKQKALTLSECQHFCFVHRLPHSKKHCTVAIMCNCKFDMEHGIAVVFENGQFKKVGQQDIIL